MLHHMFSICNKVNFEPKFDLKIFIYLKKKKKGTSNCNIGQKMCNYDLFFLNCSALIILVIG